MKKFKIVLVLTTQSSLAFLMSNKEIESEMCETALEAYEHGKDVLERYIKTGEEENKIAMENGTINFKINYAGAIILVEEIKPVVEPKKCQFCSDWLYSDVDSIISGCPSPDYGYCANPESCFYEKPVKLDHGCAQFKDGKGK